MNDVINNTVIEEIVEELKTNILAYWRDHVSDHKGDGFIGYISSNGVVDSNAPKGGILTSRILWTFSKAYRMFGNEENKKIADKAYRELTKNFLDPIHGGLYWMLHADNTILEDRKHVYNQAFGIYGLAEYYDATKDERALQVALELFSLIERYAYDANNGGYEEAFTRDWAKEEDLRLSGKDMNAPKSMNTHLHVLEAYTNLYRVSENKQVKKQLQLLLETVLTHIVDHNNNRFHLFFDMEWKPLSTIISYGHDIEGSWLLVEAAEILNNDHLVKKVSKVAVQMAEAVYQQGIASDGAVINERDGEEVDEDRIWWVQAEAMVGFLHAYELTADDKFKQAFYRLWDYTKEAIIDPTGEWYWKVDKENKPDFSLPKVEPWKCPYHNGRFAMEIVERVQKMKGVL